jgi:hypothetical protein
VQQASASSSPAPEAAVAEPICEPGSTRSCYAGAEATAGIGRCKAGVETCLGAAWSACAGAVVPEAGEDCRTPEDEDCDGRSDDCTEVEVAFATAFTSDRTLELADWGGGLAVLVGAQFWVVEPGGRVVEIWGPDEGEAAHEPGWERNAESDEAQSVDTGGAWPAALLRSYQTGGTRASYMIEQERWDGVMFRDEENADEHLQWSYDGALPWREGHAIAVKRSIASSDAMEMLDATALEYGSITGVEQRALQRKVDRLLARAKPRLVIVAAQEVEPWELDHGLFTVEGAEDEVERPDEPSEVDAPEPAAAEGGALQADASEAGAPDVEAADADAPSAMPQPPALPGELRSFAALSDGSVVILVAPGQLWSWKPRKRRWTPIEAPTLSPEPREVTLHAGPNAELLLRECSKDTTGTLQRYNGSSWSVVPLPTPACPQAPATGSDRTRWIIIGEQLWRRKPGDTEPWQRVPLPTPWRPRQIELYDGHVWLAAEAEGRWAVLVDRPVPTPRVLPAPHAPAPA